MSPEIFEGVGKVRRRRMGSDSVAKTLAEWKKANNQVDSASAIDGVKQNQRVPSKGSKKGCMRGKGGPENSVCSYRGVRQRTWGRWVAEIREPINRSHKPNKGNRLWLGTFKSAVEAALAYDEAARTMYGPYARLNFPPAYGMESQEVLNASSSSITATQTWTPDPTVTPDTTATSYFPEVCEMRTADIVREIEDVNCTPIIHRDSINDDQDEEIVNREEMKELMDHTNFSNYNGFKDEHDDFQNLLMENIFEVAPLAEIKTDYSILRQEGFHGQLDSSALRQEQNHGFGQLENFELREEGNCDSGQLENSMLIQEWNYYSCQLGNSALRQEGMCNSSQFVLSKNGHLEGGMPSDLSYQLRNPDDKLFSSSGHIEEGVDPNLNSSRPDLGLAEQGVLDLWFPELGFY